MAVLGAQTSEVTGSEVRALGAARELRDKPFRDAMLRSNQWLAGRKAAREAKTQQEFDNKLDTARELRLTHQAKSAMELADLKRTSLVLDIESRQRLSLLQEKANAESIKIYDQGMHDIEMHFSGEKLLTADRRAELIQQGEEGEGTSREKELAVMGARVLQIENGEGAKEVRKSLAKTAEARAAGNQIHGSAKEAAVDSKDGFHPVHNAGNPDGPSHWADIKAVSLEFKAEADTIINIALSSGTGLGGMSREDQKLIRRVAVLDPETQERLNELAEIKGKAIVSEAAQVSESAQEREDFLFKQEVTEEAKIRAEQRGITDAVGLARNLNEVKLELEAARPARVTTTIGIDIFGDPIRKTTIAGSAEAVALESDTISGGIVNPFEVEGVTLGQRPRGASDEQIERMTTGFRSQLDELETDILEANLALATGVGILATVSGTKEDLTELENKRSDLISRAAGLGIDLREGAETAALSPEKFTASVTTTGEGSIDAILAELNRLN